MTRWQPPWRLELEIVDVDLPLRPFEFRAASYALKEDGSRTVVTRETTIVSRLSPRWFWRPLEALTIRAEHDYLLDDLKRRLGGRPVEK